MTIQEKINMLKTCLSKTSESEYSNSVSWQEKKETEIKSILTVIETASNFFIKGVISKMDPAVLKETYEKWDALLDSKLEMFPEFKEEKVEHHI